MRDIKIQNGDTVKNSGGNYIELKGSDVLFQRVLIYLTAKKGEFIYDRTLGSQVLQIDANSENANEKAELLLNEALTKFEDTYVKVLEYGEKLKLEITICDETRIQEVRLHGDI
jgi:hypothetical protein